MKTLTTTFGKLEAGATFKALDGKIYSKTNYLEFAGIETIGGADFKKFNGIGHSVYEVIGDSGIIAKNFDYDEEVEIEIVEPGTYAKAPKPLVINTKSFIYAN